MKKYLVCKLEIVESNDKGYFGVIERALAEEMVLNGTAIESSEWITDMYPGEFQIKTELEIVAEELAVLKAQAEISDLEARIAGNKDFRDRVGY